LTDNGIFIEDPTLRTRAAMLEAYPPRPIAFLASNIPLLPILPLSVNH